MVAHNQFRADLFYRLNVFPIHVPPLRARREDIPLLVRYFVQHFARRMNRVIDTIPAESMDALVQYSWPGNIRELQNFLERAVILSSGPILRIPVAELLAATKPSSTTLDKVMTLEAAERSAILRALKESSGKVGGAEGAAHKLGMKRTTLQARMRKLGIAARAAAD
jgi:formate hydrogenlyase transcriptional activator